MRRLTLLLISIFATGALILSAGGDAVSAQETAIWEIENFNVDIALSSDSTFTVTETIETNFEIERRGIFRDIPYRSSDYTVFPPKIDILKIDLISVKDQDGNDHPYTQSTYENFSRLQIGDPDVYFSGERTYIITYKVSRGVDFYEDYDEIFWNATGNQWPVNIYNSKATLRFPRDMNPETFSQIDAKCFTGIYSSKANNCDITIDEERRSITYTSTGPYSPDEGLTILGVLPKGYIDEPSFLVKNWILIASNIGALLPLFTFPLAWFVWRRFGKDPKGRGTIVVQYEPPQNLSPAESALLVDNVIKDRFISATLIDLAVRRFIRIDQIGKKSYTFLLVNNNSTLLKDHERMMLEGMFGAGAAVGSEVSLDSLKNKFYVTVGLMKDNLYSSMERNDYIAHQPMSAIAMTAGAGSIFIILSIVAAVTLIPDGGVLTFVGLLLSALPFFVISPFMPKMTEKGVAAYEKVKGLREFIEIAEVDRLETMQGADSKYLQKDKQKTQVELFEKLLPYAIAFHLEKSWANKFKDIYAELPDWYHGDFRTFNTLNLVSSISTATNSINQTMTAQPQSSGSGSSGGFSGGGGGGGGGGSW